MEDAADEAAAACAAHREFVGAYGRCRVDFDTTVGDETYTTLKSSTEFGQRFLTSLCHARIPGLMDRRLAERRRVVEARAELNALVAGGGGGGDGDQEGRRTELVDILRNGGRVLSDDDEEEKGAPKCRVYFPDEGSAALARRDWTAVNPATSEPAVPDCVEFSSLGGWQGYDTADDVLLVFFCPRASESDSLEEILRAAETGGSPRLDTTVLVNPNLVDMGVTGFGMAGRMLRERLLDKLARTYYLRTLSWGALARVWPRDYTVWQEDADADGGYREIQSLADLPSNPEVEDIYDVANGLARENAEGTGLLNALGDFVNGMMRL